VSKRSKAFRVSTLFAVLACAVAIPATASASTLWVSTNHPSAPYTSCLHPGYSHIEEAVHGPGTAIHVCEGTYAEQLTIERTVTITGYGGATVTLPAVTSKSSSACDTANEALNHLEDQDAVSICGGKVTIKNLNVNAIWPGEPVGPGVSCAYNLTGILVAGGADLVLSGSTVTGAAPQKINGCQYGLGILVGVPESGSIGTGAATLTNDIVTGYQKNGITAAGEGVGVKINKVTVTGAGIEPAIAQNGIGIQEGAKGTMTGVTVSGNECEDTPACGPEAVTQYQADGIYFYDAAEGSSVTNSTSNENDVGIEAFDTPSTDPSILGSKLERNRDEAVQISQGQAKVNNDTLTNSNVGIQILQFEGQTAAPGGTANHDTITGMSKWAVFGASDNAAGDLLSEFTITGSKISGNPGPTPLKSVETQNPAKLKIYAEKDT
jgi:nitrous oxidase accessory protein NosD